MDSEIIKESERIKNAIEADKAQGALQPLIEKNNMREIKFRAWDKEHKHFKYFSAELYHYWYW